MPISSTPLASRLRPNNLNEFIGQHHLLADGKPLYQMFHGAKLHSMIFWGPPGTGKTTLARLLANVSHAQFINLSAVMVGIKEVREVMLKAKAAKEQQGQETILFIDEIHRFNKSQQDAFLPYVEDGTVVLIGATTENPSFELNSALLSRCHVLVLNPLTENELIQIINRALEYGFNSMSILFPEELKIRLAKASDGDARIALNMLEILIEQAKNRNKSKAQTGTKPGIKTGTEIGTKIGKEKNIIMIDTELFDQAIIKALRRFDKSGENFYDQISALHKALRGSSPDGALYWLARMLDGGCDPIYIARRITRMASEDIGNADPKALTLALNAWDVQERLGSPEGELALAQTVVYLALAPKSNAVYTAFKAAQQDVRERGTLEVPLHLRNAPTPLMKSLHYGKEYRYDHDEEGAFAAGQTYFPKELGEKKYYFPKQSGLEIKISEKLAHLRSLSKKEGGY